MAGTCKVHFWVTTVVYKDTLPNTNLRRGPRKLEAEHGAGLGEKTRRPEAGYGMSSGCLQLAEPCQSFHRREGGEDDADEADV